MALLRFRKKQNGYSQTGFKDISGLTHGVAGVLHSRVPASLLERKEGVIIQEALVETIGCSGMTHSAAMAARDSSRINRSGGSEYRPGM